MRHHGEKYDKYIKYNGKWSKFDCGVGSSTFKFVDLAAFYVHLFLVSSKLHTYPISNSEIL
jgi:hypothetical protein